MTDRDSFPPSEQELEGASEDQPKTWRINPKIKSAAVRVLSPGLFSTFTGKMDSPLPGGLSRVASTYRALRERMAGDKGFESLEDVLEDNPEFEAIRKIAMRRLRTGALLSLAFLFATLFWELMYGFHVWPDPFGGFNDLLPVMACMVSFANFIANDLRYFVFKHRLMRLSFRQYITLRMGYGLKSKR